LDIVDNSFFASHALLWSCRGVAWRSVAAIFISFSVFVLRIRIIMFDVYNATNVFCAIPQ